MTLKHYPEKLEFILAHKTALTEEWINDAVSERLRARQVDPDFFRRHFALAAVDYLLAASKDAALIGRCPKMVTMLYVFRDKEFMLNDVLFVCNGLKNCLMLFLVRTCPEEIELIEELCAVLDKNTESVLDGYLLLNHQKVLDDVLSKEMVLSYDNDNLISLDEAEVENPERLEHARLLAGLLDMDELAKMERKAGEALLAYEAGGDLKTHLGLIVLALRRYIDLLEPIGGFSPIKMHLLQALGQIENHKDRLVKHGMLNNALVKDLQCLINNLVCWRKSLLGVSGFHTESLEAQLISNTDSIYGLLRKQLSTADETLESLDKEEKN